MVLTKLKEAKNILIDSFFNESILSNDELIKLENTFYDILNKLANYSPEFTQYNFSMSGLRQIHSDIVFLEMLSLDL